MCRLIVTETRTKQRRRDNMSLSSKEERRSPLLEFLKGPTARYLAALSPEEKLKWVLRFVRTPLPEREEGWRQLEEMVLRFYIVNMGPGALLWARNDKGGDLQQIPGHMGPPSPKRKEWPEWIRTLRDGAYVFLMNVFSQLVTQKKGAKRPRSEEKLRTGLFPVEYTSGRRFSVVRGGKLVHIYEGGDNISPFLLTLGDLLAEIDLSKLTLCTSCYTNLFYKAKRQKYCSLECARKAHPSKDRVRKSRKCRVEWTKAKEVLAQPLADMDAIARKQKLQQPRSERQVLGEAEKALEKARVAFKAAFPLRKGQGYEEGEAFLAHAKKQVLKLRKRVKGY
jgi:hypothetical protein